MFLYLPWGGSASLGCFLRISVKVERVLYHSHLSTKYEYGFKRERFRYSMIRICENFKFLQSLGCRLWAWLVEVKCNSVIEVHLVLDMFNLV